MKHLTVNELAKASGVSVRTLHHYHQIGLLVPATVGANGYRYYGEDQALRLQQILFWREIGVSLANIRGFLDRPGADPAVELAGHRSRLSREARRTARLLKTIDRTLAVLKGEREMKIDELYDGFLPHRQDEYHAWIEERLGAEAIRASVVPERPGPELMEALRPIEAALADAFLRGTRADDPQAAPLLDAHRQWVGQAWGRECDPAAYGRLADLYEHPDFRSRFDTLASGLADWLLAAMRAHAARSRDAAVRA